MPQLPFSSYPRSTRVLAVAAASLIASGLLVFGSASEASAAKKCISIGQKTICFDNGKGQKQDGENQTGGAGSQGGDQGNDGGNGGGDQGGGQGNDGGNGGGGGGDADNNPQPQAKPLDCSKAQCDAGEIKLDTPSRYGACCAPAEGLCPADRPVGTPPNCCAQGTVFREGGCYPETCGPGMVGTPPHCDRVCPEGKFKVDQTCYDPCPAGTLGTPPNCHCPSGQIWDKAASVCKGCPEGMVGTPPNCQCPPQTVMKDGACQKCTSGMVVKDGQCQCPSNKVYVKEDDKCRKCEGDKEVIKGVCACRHGTIEFPPNSDRCAKGTKLACRWDGTAPFCDGECSPGEIQMDRSYDQNHVHEQDHTGFGKSCSTGNKVYCCRPGF